MGDGSGDLNSSCSSSRLLRKLYLVDCAVTSTSLQLSLPGLSLEEVVVQQSSPVVGDMVMIAVADHCHFSLRRLKVGAGYRLPEVRRDSVLEQAGQRHTSRYLHRSGGTGAGADNRNPRKSKQTKKGSL